ncbi:acyl-CoA thioesterase [Maridesulfovibrio hydrothermalis]|uniref:Thioesterase superfamily protein n=1 Tax=Maridesulfovibrio hydrothermalis AM13 = DSM 14728 TaxID=1121451 RepID=L0R9K8_9BACT|nr:acyl-CoA thioesterase [Maridesulfovibrio hydrothermalis]CCO23424.1 Thioesterase superfamily protein [Maridesulfovibrio hydrothermalis AM13 = DSM 14728]
MSRKAYFSSPSGCPAPLCHTVERTVRFEEVDPMNIVWHGRYPGYFEDGRVALGDMYGIGYMDLYKYKIAAPIKKMQVDYIKPLHFGETFSIETMLHWTEAARMNYEFIIRNSDGEKTTTGCTVQLFVQDGELMMYQPDFFAEMCLKWKENSLSPLRPASR